MNKEFLNTDFGNTNPPILTFEGDKTTYRESAHYMKIEAYNSSVLKCIENVQHSENTLRKLSKKMNSPKMNGDGLSFSKNVGKTLGAFEVLVESFEGLLSHIQANREITIAKKSFLKSMNHLENILGCADYLVYHEDFKLTPDNSKLTYYLRTIMKYYGFILTSCNIDSEKFDDVIFKYKKFMLFFDMMK